MQYDCSISFDEDVSKSRVENGTEWRKSSTHLYLNTLMGLSIASFITTFFSLLLMIFFLRKCTRIYIHMNLLSSFMLRSLVFIWSQTIWIYQDPNAIENGLNQEYQLGCSVLF